MKLYIGVHLTDDDAHIIRAIKKKAHTENRSVSAQALRYIREGLDRDSNPVAEALCKKNG